MNEITDEEYEAMYKNYMIWIIELEPSDPPDYLRAADVLLAYLQQYCNHPCIYYTYQLPSLAHLARSVHQRPMNLVAFRHYFDSLLIGANAGRLRDTRIVDN
jgi:hypothetical protein